MLLLVFNSVRGGVYLTLFFTSSVCVHHSDSIKKDLVTCGKMFVIEFYII